MATMTQTTGKWRQNNTCGHNIRLRASEGYINRRQHQSPCLCLFFPPSCLFRSNQSGSPLNHWRPYINWWPARATDWPQQLQTKPQCLQSSWVRPWNRGGNRKREEGRRGEKNDQGKWDHNGAHRNLRSRPKNMELSTCGSWERIQMLFM